MVFRWVELFEVESRRNDGDNTWGVADTGAAESFAEFVAKGTETWITEEDEEGHSEFV